MAKSSLERQIERQMKQSKQLANKKRREQDKAERRAILKDRSLPILSAQSLCLNKRDSPSPASGAVPVRAPT